MSLAKTTVAKASAESRFLHTRRRLLKTVGQVYQALLTRITVRGLENIPAQGPLLVLPNYLSDLDPHVVGAQFPHELDVIAQGDFRNVWYKHLAFKIYEPLLIHRGEADREAMKGIVSLLEAKRMVLLFPTGGMWEHGLVAKPGAAYLSQLTQTPILPVGIGGTYMRSPDVLALKRPEITVTFGEVMPPVPESKDRRSRRADLDAASAAIMQRVYHLLPPVEQAMYDRWTRERYELRVEFSTNGDETPTAVDEFLPDMGALAEFIAKPNLFRPMWKNVQLPVEPFLKKRFFPAAAVRAGAQALLNTLTNGDFETYLPFRLGNEKTSQAIHALKTLIEVTERAAARGMHMRLTPLSHDTSTVS